MGIAIKDCRHGRMMFYENDFYIGRSLALYGEYSEGEVQLWQQFLKPGMCVIDVGANIGCHTVYFAKAVGPRGAVFAMEPQRQLYQMLAGNLALNELSNVQIVLGAAGEASGSVGVPAVDFGSLGNFGHVVLGEGKPVEEVPVLMLDTLMTHAPVHLIKIDVEGMEDKVLAGAERLIEKHKPILYVENDDRADLIDRILGYGYRLFWHTPSLFHPANFSGVANNIFDGVVSVNMICIHASQAGKINLREIKSPDDKSGVVLREKRRLDA